MMNDFAITWQNGAGDLVSLDDACFTDDSLVTAIIISLFTDARVENQRGWWGNDFGQGEMGSRLWTLFRSKQLAEILDDAEDYAAIALQWIIDDGHALNIRVTATNPDTSVLLLDIDVQLPSGEMTQYSFRAQWSL